MAPCTIWSIITFFLLAVKFLEARGKKELSRINKSKKYVYNLNEKHTPYRTTLLLGVHCRRYIFKRHERCRYIRPGDNADCVCDVSRWFTDKLKLNRTHFYNKGSLRKILSFTLLYFPSAFEENIGFVVRTQRLLQVD